MNTQLLDIRRMLPLLNMAFQAEQLKLAKITQRINGLKQQLDTLDRPGDFDPMGAAARLGADVLWETWVQDRRKLINQELALAARDREIAKAQLIAALSKREAAKQLELRATAAAWALQERRASY